MNYRGIVSGVTADGTRTFAMALVVACIAYALTPLASADMGEATATDYALLAALLVVFVATITVCLWSAARDREIRNRKWLLVAGQYSAVALWGFFGPEWSVLPAVAAGAGLLVWPALTAYPVVAVTAFTSLFLAVRDQGWGAETVATLGRGFIVLVVFAAIASVLSLRRRLEQSARDTARVAVMAGQDRIYRDLHDLLGRSLTVIAVRSDIAATLCASDPSTAELEMLAVNTTAREAISDMRSVVRGNRHTGVAREIRVARDLLAAAGVRVDVDASTPELPPNVDDAFGWVVRESVTNILRHGQSRSASISLCSNITEHRLIVDNDTARNASDSSGSGLDGMRERLRSVGGTLDITDDAGAFTVTAIVPVEQENR